MYCMKCGAQNDDNNYKCVRCGAVLQHVDAPQPPLRIPNYLVQAILVTVLCCLPFGIVAIVYAAQVNTKLQAGDIRGAKDASKNARMWCWIAFGVGLAAGVIYAVYGVSAITDSIRGLGY